MVIFSFYPQYLRGLPLLLQKDANSYFWAPDSISSLFKKHHTNAYLHWCSSLSATLFKFLLFQITLYLFFSFKIVSNKILSACSIILSLVLCPSLIHSSFSEFFWVKSTSHTSHSTFWQSFYWFCLLLVVQSLAKSCLTLCDPMNWSS